MDVLMLMVVLLCVAGASGAGAIAWSLLRPQKKGTVRK